MSLFQYNSQQWFNTDSIETIDDHGYDIGVMLKSGREVRLPASRRDAFFEAIRGHTDGEVGTEGTVIPKSGEAARDQTMVERVGDELRNECLKVFGSTWGYDVAWRFAEVAINVICEKIAAVALDRGDEELGEIIIAALKAR